MQLNLISHRNNGKSVFPEIVALHNYNIKLRNAMLELLGQFEQAHEALGVSRSPSAIQAINDAKELLGLEANKQIESK